MDKHTFRLTLPVLLLASPGAAQVALPSVPLPAGTLDRSIERVTRVADPVLADAGRTFAAVRETRLENLVRANPKILELTRGVTLAARRGADLRAWRQCLERVARTRLSLPGQ